MVILLHTTLNFTLYTSQVVQLQIVNTPHATHDAFIDRGYESRRVTAAAIGQRIETDDDVYWLE